MCKSEPLKGVTLENLLHLLQHVQSEMTSALNQNGQQLANFRTIRDEITTIAKGKTAEHPEYSRMLRIHRSALDGIKEEDAEDLSMKGTAGLMDRYWPALEAVVRRHFEEVQRGTAR